MLFYSADNSSKSIFFRRLEQHFEIIIQSIYHQQSGFRSINLDVENIDSMLKKLDKIQGTEI